MQWTFLDIQKPKKIILNAEIQIRLNVKRGERHTMPTLIKGRGRGGFQTREYYWSKKVSI
jgi:hypothetical protein